MNKKIITTTEISAYLYISCKLIHKTPAMALYAFKQIHTYT